MSLSTSLSYSKSFSAQRKRRLTSLLVLAVLLFIATTMLVLPERTRLQCAGKMSTKYGFRPATVNAHLERSGWALREWRNVRGYLQLEIPNDAFFHYDVVRNNGDVLALALSDDPNSVGSLSPPTGYMELRTPRGLFLGSCARAD
jgi:hypothetical protein